MLAGTVPAAKAAKKAAEGLTGLEILDGEWFYLPETVPAEFLPETETPVREIVLYGSGDEGEYAESVTVEFAEGDEALKNALRAEQGIFTVYRDGQPEEISAAGYTVDLSDLREPGQASFRLVCESAHYTAEQKCTLRVLSWEEDPLVTVSEAPLVLSLNDRRTERQIVEGLAEDHAGEIGARRFGMDEAAATEKVTAFFDPESHEEIQMDTFYLNVINEQKEPGTAVVHLQDPRTGENSYQFRETGSYEAGCFIIFGNIRCRRTGTVAVVPYRIGGVREISPGGNARAVITDEESSGRTFIWAVKGAGLEIDPMTGELAAAESAAIGSTYTVSAVPSDGGLPVKAAGTVVAGALSAERFELKEFGEGFTVPVLSSENGKYENGFSGANRLVSRNAEALPYLLYEDVTYEIRKEFMETREAALAAYAEFRTEGMAEIEQEIIEIGEKPAMLLTARTPAKDPEQPDLYFGLIRMARNNVLLQFQFFSYTGQDGDIEDLPRIRMDDLQRIAQKVEYDPEKASITVEDGALTLSSEDGQTIVSAGQRLQMNAEFANPEKVNRKAGNNEVVWSVRDAETGEEPEDITIDEDGTLTVKRALKDAAELEVRAASPIFHTEAAVRVHAVPLLRRMTAEPGELSFYAGTDTPQTVRVRMEPETVPAIGIDWSANKEEIVEIIPKEDGSAEVRPLAAGRVIISAKSPGGKYARVNATVMEPVKSLALSVKAAAKPGKTITVTAAIEPRQAGNKKLEWSVESPDGTASINQRGQLKIPKDAAAGTVITVTCRATGAPEPVEEKIEITVE